MVQCYRCRLEKSDEDFSFKNKAKGIKQTHCKECQREISKDWYVRNSKMHRDRVKRVKYDSRNDILEFLRSATLRCTKCGQDHLATLDFHHRDPNTKDYSLAVMMGGSYKLETFIREFDKCDILCANCHRKHHWDEGGDKQSYIKLLLNMDR
jgi:hypothetical protein